MTNEPIALNAALARFEELWSPRIVTRVNDYDVRIAKVAGEHIWHAHSDTDEFFLVLAGELHISLRDGENTGANDGDTRHERTVVLGEGSVFVVPRGVEHKPYSGKGASIMMFERAGTSTTGDTHDPIPEHIHTTTGRTLE